MDSTKVRPSENVEDRRRRGVGDYAQRHRIRVSIAEGEYRNGPEKGASYTREDVGRWLDKNDPDDGTYLEAAARDMEQHKDTPLKGHSQDVTPDPNISRDMYQGEANRQLLRPDKPKSRLKGI
jgi:hypothetical protein